MTEFDSFPRIYREAWDQDITFVTLGPDRAAPASLDFVLVHAFFGGDAVLADIPGRGICVPSGHVEAGEMPLEAAVREAYEETGARIDPSRCKLIGYHCFTSRSGDVAGVERYAAAFVAEVDHFDPIPDGSESNGRLLIPPQDIATRYFVWDELMEQVFRYAEQEYLRLFAQSISGIQPWLAEPQRVLARSEAGGFQRSNTRYTRKMERGHETPLARIGYARRAFFSGRETRRDKRAVDPSRSQMERLRRTLRKREHELAEARTQVHGIELAHDERNAEAEALRRVGEAVGALFDLEEMLRVVAGIAVQVTSTDSSQVYLINDARDELVLRAVDDEDASRGVVGKIRLKVGEGLAGWVALHKQAAAVSHHAYQDSRFKLVPELEEHKYQSMLSVPLIYRNEVIGVINVRTLKPHTYTQTQVRLLQSIASQVAGAVENSRQYRKMERRATQLSTLSEVSKTITSDMYLEEILQLIVAATATSMNFKITTLMLVDEEKGELVIKATQSKSREYNRKPNIKIGESIAGRAIAEARTITVADVRHAPDYKFPDIARKEGLCAMAAVPLAVKGKIIGVLNCYSEKPHYFTDEEISFLTALGNHAAIAIEHAKLMVKSAIIQEMHHRVKNNLQQVASLLRLQMHFVGERTTEEVLQESLNRILAIASVHELLSREDLDIISVKQIGESILNATRQSVVSPFKRIALSVEGPDILLPSSQATSVALILNELVQNAVEHGFGDGADDGSISIVLREDARQIELSVTNDGNGLPDDFDRQKEDSLGLQIVEQLARGDLGGCFSLCAEQGRTKATLLFPK